MLKPSSKAVQAHREALRLIGNNRDAAPRLAQVLGIAGAYELYLKVEPGPGGWPAQPTQYVAVAVAHGPAGSIMYDYWIFDDYGTAVRAIAEKAIVEVEAETAG